MRECRRRTTLVRSAVIQRTHTDPVTRIVSGPSIPGVQTYPEARVLPVDQTLGTQGYFLACLVRDHHMVFDARFEKGWWGKAGPKRGLECSHGGGKVASHGGVLLVYMGDRWTGLASELALVNRVPGTG